jgi:hypothetical protein
MAFEATQLQEAFKGAGTDEDAVIKIIFKQNPHQIEAIKAEYHKKFGKTLEDAVKSELSGNFEKVVLGYMKSYRQFDSDTIMAAMKGAGTDENTLLQFLITRSNEHKEEIKKIFMHDHKKSLESWVKDELSGDLEKFGLALLNPRAPESSVVSDSEAEKEADKLYKAGEGKIGTDEKTFIEIFTHNSWHSLKKIFTAYEKSNKHHTIDKAIESEFSGHLKYGLLATCVCARNPAEFWADVIRAAVKGAGTDDSTLIRAIVGNRETLEDIKTAFSGKYHKSLWETVSSETSGDYKKSLLAIIHN